MALIHIARDHKPLGTIAEDELRDGIFSGKYVATDLVWREGMAEWKPLSEMASQWGMETPAPALVPVVKTEPVSPAAESGTEPAWEDRERLGIFPAITRTVSAVLMRPAETFAAMKRAGGLADPLLYFVLLSSTMFAVSALYQMAASSFNPTTLPPNFPHASKGALSVALIGSILLSPALYVISAFLSSGITHLCLKLLGGANRPFETTFRVICYAQASAAVFNLLPLCGSLIGLIWGAYVIIIGLREAQQTTGWKATLAITLPGLVCCGILFVVFAAAGIGIAEMGKGFGGLPSPVKLP
jgi:hypothetical protein